jgi:hypothetical protein
MRDENDAVLPPIRLSRNLLVAARNEADRRDETLSQVVRRALRAYISQAPLQMDLIGDLAADGGAKPKKARKPRA